MPFYSYTHSQMLLSSLEIRPQKGFWDPFHFLSYFLTMRCKQFALPSRLCSCHLAFLPLEIEPQKLSQIFFISSLPEVFTYSDERLTSSYVLLSTTFSSLPYSPLTFLGTLPTHSPITTFHFHVICVLFWKLGIVVQACNQSLLWRLVAGRNLICSRPHS